MSFLRMLKKTKVLAFNVSTYFFERILHRSEIKKFKDNRRKAIWSKIVLTKDQIDKIDQLFLHNYGEKVDYVWHRHYTAFTGKFDEKYFPELLYIPKLERFLLSYNRSFSVSISDKNIIPCLSKSISISSPKVFCSRANGIFRDSEYNMLTKDCFENLLGNLGEAFIKPSEWTASGKGCAVINMFKGKDILSGKSVGLLIKEFGQNFIVQERLKCHISLKTLYPSSVNTFRVITYIWKDQIYHAPIILRIGQGGKCVDNAHVGGIFIAVDDDGTLHKTAFTEFNCQYTEHPDTHIKFEGYKIPNISKLIDAAYKMQSAFPHLCVYNWDFTLNEAGEPVLIEANVRGGSIWLVQMAHGKGVFGNNTAEILRWMSFMKKMPASKRKLYRPGYYKPF